jgi:diguanylate cyclase (GGDEF)-like protein
VRGNGRVGVLFLDLDDFKLVNDAHGHQAGDKVLRDVGTRLASTLRGSDTLGRMGGDEFAIVLPTASLDAASAVATRVQAAMAAAFMVETVGLHIGVSIGIAVAPDSGTDADELLRCADVAMFVAKRSGSEQRIYSVDMDAPVVQA